MTAAMTQVPLTPRLESYSIKDETTYNREIPPLVKYAKAHEDWKCLLITYDEEGPEEGIPVVPVWKWLILVSS